MEDLLELARGIPSDVHWSFWWKILLSVQSRGQLFCSLVCAGISFSVLVHCLSLSMTWVCVCWLKLATRPVLQRPKWITWQGSKRATILEHQKDRSFDSFGEAMRLQRPLFVSGNACGSLQHARFVDVCRAFGGIMARSVLVFRSCFFNWPDYDCKFDC